MNALKKGDRVKAQQNASSGQLSVAGVPIQPGEEGTVLGANGNEAWVLWDKTNRPDQKYENGYNTSGSFRTMDLVPVGNTVPDAYAHKKEVEAKEQGSSNGGQQQQPKSQLYSLDSKDGTFVFTPFKEWINHRKWFHK